MKEMSYYGSGPSSSFSYHYEAKESNPSAAGTTLMQYDKKDSGSVHSIPIDALPVRYCKIRTSKRPDEKVGFTLAGSKLNPGVHKVINLVRNSPAAASGLRDEDYLIEVSGVPVQHMNYFDVIDLIREKKIEDDLELMVADAATAQSYKSKAQPMHF